MSTHPATRIAELERELAGARFAAQQHLQTVEAQAAIIARYSQPILSAVVASDEREKFEAWAATAEPGYHLFWNLTNSSAQRYTSDRAQHTFEGFKAGLSAALASAPAQPVAAIPEATGGLPPLPEPICVKPASGPLFSDGQMTAFALDALARLPAIPEAGQSVLTDEDCMRIIDQSEIAMEGYNYVTLTSLIRLALATMSADAQAKGEQA